jgi:hypothetical protein
MGSTRSPYCVRYFCSSILAVVSDAAEKGLELQANKNRRQPPLEFREPQLQDNNSDCPCPTARNL